MRSGFLEFSTCIALIVSLSACSEDATSPDATIADAALIDAVVECREDTECNDGLFCNGVESCSPEGLCESGIIVECNDGIPCTIDLCSNQTRECISVAPDVDEDGHGDGSCLDGNNEPLGDDCDDLDPNRFPGNIEFCDAENHDEDCDSETFGIVDVDGDGFAADTCCNTDALGELVCGNDCDDTRGNINITVTEACDGLDNNCNAIVDEGVTVPGFIDADGDGFGDDNQPMQLCAGSAKFAVQGGDCEDEDPSINPGQLEFCDGIDNDCNDAVDDNTQIVSWYVDDDGDLFGDPNQPAIESCSPINGRSVLDTDCDDTAASINPSSQELCDGIDNDCNGLADFQIGINDFEDDDGDGLVDIACSPLGVDCDDTNPVTGPGTIEQCDGQDNDCDGIVDENVVQTLWFRDVDDDGFGTVTAGTLVSCEQPLGYSAAGGDCDDSDGGRNPAALERCNGSDDDCDSAIDESPAIDFCANPTNGAGVCQQGVCAFDCTAGFDDCNGIIDDGCEANVANDSNNCGQCGLTCNGNNQSGSCNSGQCECSAGFGDCDGDPSNGCEVDLSINNDNCNQCGNACDFQNALSQCNAGVCEVQICIPGFDDCDGTLGCETNVITDTNCGACDNDCTAIPNTSSFCNGDSDCEVTSCSLGFLDCRDGDGVDAGCETNPQTDAENCGGCFEECGGIDNGTGNCVAGLCTCEGSFRDCGNGPCETDIQNDINNCGDCGIDCNALVTSGQPSCNAGVCEAQCGSSEGDCDADPLDCETNFNGVDNCGACGNVCSATNGFASCSDFGSGPQCSAQCDFGFEDCDTDQETCEVDRDSDPQNCGGCGNDCGVGGTCDFGSCSGVVSVGVGENFTCALRTGGTVACWGDNVEGQLGNGATLPGNPSSFPVLVDTVAAGQISQLASGAKHSCAIGVTGVYCWGDNGSGQLGSDTSGVSSSTPIEVGGGLQFVSISVGVDHTCGVDSNSDGYCWGSNTRGQLGQGTTGPGNFVPVGVSTASIISNNTERIIAGDGYSCAITFGQSVFCWGEGSDGQLGNGLGTDNPEPSQLGSLNGVQSLSAGSLSACSVRNVSQTSILDCWGNDDQLQLGNGAPVNTELSPTSTGLSSARTVSVGESHACMLTNFGFDSVFCWGDNSLGQGGQGNTASPIAGGTQVTAVGNSVRELGQGVGANHVCIVNNSDQVVCWGDNSSGQIGVDPTIIAPDTFVTTPTIVIGL